MDGWIIALPFTHAGSLQLWSELLTNPFMKPGRSVAPKITLYILEIESQQPYHQPGKTQVASIASTMKTFDIALSSLPGTAYELIDLGALDITDLYLPFFYKAAPD